MFKLKHMLKAVNTFTIEKNSFALAKIFLRSWCVLSCSRT